MTKKPRETLEYENEAAETLTAGPVAVLSGVLIAVMSAAILYNALWRQPGLGPVGPVSGEPSNVRIITAEQDDPSSLSTAGVPAGERNRKGDKLIAAIQRELAALGLFDGYADGVVGQRTRQAVFAYQRKNNLAENGRADKALLEHMRFTRQLLSASDYTNSIETPVADEKIRRVQTGLAALGYQPGEFDGFLGNQTRASIRQFEKDRGWPETGELTSALIGELKDIGAYATENSP